jgi:hypothetical protein
MWAVALVVGGCSPDTVSLEPDGGTGTDGGDAPAVEAVTLSVYRGVDILFVIDNSGSMGEEQSMLSAGVGAFLDALPPDVRIGITTTDHGNPWCDETTPEEGALVASSCRSRPQDFVFAGAQPYIEDACLPVCPKEGAEISLPDPWLELRADGDDDLPDGVSAEVSLRCLLPQGINGCGFEQHLEAMAATLRRSSTEGDPAEGFLRPDALLAIVVVTDEADCSYNPAYESIFASEGQRVFWEDPDATAPSSAICWNAGVTCSGRPDGYDCRAADLGLDGQAVAPGTAESDAVLRPVAGYVHALRQLEIAKQRIAPEHEILVALIAGLGSDGEPVYADAQMDPTFQSDVGIGPGCQSNAVRAVPPVRMLQLADTFRVGDRRNTFSVCDEDYGPALAEIADAIASQARPACVPMCVALDGTCEVSVQTRTPEGTTAEISIPACGPDGMLPAPDVDTCAAVVSDLSPQCRADGGNLELRFTHRDGGGFPRDATVIARCDPSPDPATDCPPA